MPSVDNRVVRMEFDNTAFDSKVKSTLVSLQQLDKALKLEGAQKGLIGVQEAGKKVNFSHIGTSIAGVNTKFVEMDTKVKNSTTNAKNLDTALKFPSAIKGLAGVQSATGKVDGGMAHVGATVQGVSAKFLGVSTVAITALSNITTTAMIAGGQIVKSLSIGPILDGYKEYETNIGSIQTILANTASKGTNLTQVNAALDELNTYSDKTIYNFGQMARNIGTFTAAGVGLKESTSAIKGIANLAAMSGSSADQASSAMYQLSQAMASGSVKAQDWISVVNSGMGGEAFQKSLFETAKALHTVKNVPIGQTFEDWKKKGGNFKEWMSTGAITSKVLAQSLETFTGDMTKAQLVAKGYSATQADSILKTAKLASDAATQVKTFTQLLGTIKEAIGTGWADTFKILIGNFEEAKQLWTGINNFIGSIVGNQAKARNDLLKGWKAFGGRLTLLKDLKMAFFNLQRAFNPIRLAFRQIFPRTTVKQLLMMTLAFEKFAKSLRPSGETVVKLNRIFKGFFAALSIGWTILKEGVKFVLRIAKALGGLAGPGVLEFAAKIGDMVFALQQFLVKGKGIESFFGAIGDAIVSVIPPIQDFIGLVVDKLGPIFSEIGSKIVEFSGGLGSFSDAIKNPIPFIQGLVDKIKSLFGIMGDTGVPEKLGNATGRVGQRVKTLSTLWDKFAAGFSKVWDTLSKIGEELKNFFVNLGSAIAGAMGKGDFNNVLDIINVGLLGAILLTIRKFFKKGYLFDIGGGLFGKIKQTFEQLTGVLKALQTQLKAQALKEIAIAMGILTLSIIALSMIDSVKLTQAMGAMAVGFGQLIGVLKLLDTMKLSLKTVTKFIILAGVFTLLAIGIVILARAVKKFSSIDPAKLALGLGAVAAVLGMFVGVIKLLKDDTEVFIGTGAALILFAVGVNVLYFAVKKFADMDVVKLGQGMVAVGGSIVGLVLALKNINEKDVDRKGLAVLKLSTALFVLGFAVERFAKMDYKKLVKGLGAATLGLYGIAKAMDEMPKDMKEKSAGVLLASIAMLLMAKAMGIIGNMSIAEILTSLITMSVMLEILIGAMEGTTLALPGAQALLVIAASLAVLAIVLKTFASIPFADLLKGLMGMVLVIAVLAAAAGALSASGLILAMEGLGAALLLIGGGFALFGAGAYFAAKALETFSKMGKKGAQSAVDALAILSTILPQIVSQLVQGFIDSFIMIADQAPKIAKAAGKLLGSLIDEITKLLPKVGKLFSKLIEEGLKVIRTYVKEYVKTGIFIILTLLDGIRQAIPQIVILVGEIIVGFLKAMDKEVPRIIEALTRLFIDVMKGLAKASGRIMGELGPGLAISFMEGFVGGLTDNFSKVWNWFTEMPGKILDLIKSLFGIDSPSKSFMSIGADIISGLLQGLVDNIFKVMNWFLGLAETVIGWVGDATLWLVDKGKDIIQGLWDGLVFVWDLLWGWFTGLGQKIIDVYVDAALWLLDAGKTVLQGLWDGLKFVWNLLWIWYVDIPKKILSIFVGAIKWLLNLGKDILQGLWNGLKSVWNSTWSWLTTLPGKIKGFISAPLELLKSIGSQVIEGLKNGFVAGWHFVTDFIGSLPQKFKDFIASMVAQGKGPLNWLADMGGQILQGLANGFKKGGEIFKIAWNALIDMIPLPFVDRFKIKSPSKLMIYYGKQLVVGLAVGINDNRNVVKKAMSDLTDSMIPDTTSVNSAFQKIVDGLSDMNEFNPTITPVLDLTKVQTEASKISGIMGAQALTPSFNNARIISSSINAQKDVGTESTATSGQVNFHQTINAPEQLSTADIYKQTRNQIRMAKEELKIP